MDREFCALHHRFIVLFRLDSLKLASFGRKTYFMRLKWQAECTGGEGRRFDCHYKFISNRYLHFSAFYWLSIYYYYALLWTIKIVRHKSNSLERGQSIWCEYDAAVGGILLEYRIIMFHVARNKILLYVILQSSGMCRGIIIILIFFFRRINKLECVIWP